MNINLKLEIFRISLKKRGGSTKDLLNFSEFFKDAFSESDKEKAYKEFIKKYIESFNNTFQLNKDKTKGISARKDHNFVPRSKQNIIDGDVIGGNTGIEKSIYNQKDPNVSKGAIDTDDVSTLPYFLKIWTPHNHNTGVLMVQSYSSSGLTVTDIIKIHLSRFFNTYGYSIVITHFVPEEMKEHFKKNSKVYKMAIVKERLNRDKRSLINPIFAEFQNLKVRIEISGFKKSVEDFWDKLKGEDNKIIASNLEDFDIKSSDDFETIAYYQDDEGHKSHTSIRKNYEIKPTIFLDDNLKQEDSEYFDFIKLKKHTDSILNKIKEEIGYTQNDK